MCYIPWTYQSTGRQNTIWQDVLKTGTLMKLIVKQVQNNEEEEEEEMCLQPVNMSFPVMKELSATNVSD